MQSAGFPEILILLITAILPLLVIGLVVYAAVRLAIRHGHRSHQR